MKTNSKNVDIVLISIIIFLSLTFISSFIFSGSGKTKKKILKSALVSSKIKDDINSIKIKCGEEEIEFRKFHWNSSESFWFCFQEFENTFYMIPCKNQKITDFLSELFSVRNFEKVILKKSNKADFGFDEENSFSVFIESSSETTGFTFGNTDFTGSKIYVENKTGDLFLVDNKPFDKFLFTGINQWYDPYLISRELGVVYKEENIMSPKIDELLELRHGGLSYYKPSDFETPEKIMKIEMGDTASFELSFYKIPNEFSYHVQIKYSNPIKGNDIVPEYAVKISEWTYKKLN